jgi:hypothetical protein
MVLGRPHQVASQVLEGLWCDRSRECKSVAGGSDVAPDARRAITEQHRYGDAELNQPDRRRELHVPRWSLGRDLTGELKDSGWHPQDARQEHDKDQPEGPAPTADDAHGKQRQQRSQHEHRGDFGRPVIAGHPRLLIENLVEDRTCRHEEQYDNDPVSGKQGDHDRLDAGHRGDRPASTTSQPPEFPCICLEARTADAAQREEYRT